MKSEKKLTIREFSNLSGISIHTLRYYDKECILSPSARGENNYREYDYGQIDMAWMIDTLRRLDVPLRDVKKYAFHRTPQKTYDLFINKLDIIDQKINALLKMRSTISHYTDEINRCKNIVPPKFELEERKETSIHLSPIISDYNYLHHFMINFINKSRNESDILSNSIGRIYSPDIFRESGLAFPRQFYINSAGGEHLTEPGLYLISYDGIEENKNGMQYYRIQQYLKKNQLEICGNIYADCPLDEICVSDTSNYLVRVAMRVKYK